MVVIHTCLRCGHEWAGRKTGRPLVCPDCKSKVWDQPRPAYGPAATRFPELDALEVGASVLITWDRALNPPRALARSIAQKHRNTAKQFWRIGQGPGVLVTRKA